MSSSRSRDPGAPRLDSIDLLRGLVIVLMVLDHVREYFHDGRYRDPLELGSTTAALFATRWITHFCAPTFVFLAGASAWLQRARGKAGPALTRFLAARGAWLVVLEATVVSVAWQFWSPSALVLQVIGAIGVAMVALAFASRLPANAVLALGAAVVLAHNLLDPIDPTDLGALAWLWTVLHEGGAIANAPVRVVVAYPVLPWVGIMLLGYGFGRAFELAQPQRRRIVFRSGLGLLLAFLLLRAIDVYGDPGHWHRQDRIWKTLGDFVDVKKYPPSLQYTLMTLGPVLLLWPWLERTPARIAGWLLPFGRAPLFAYIVHLYLVHALSMLLGTAMGRPVAAFVNPLFEPTPEGRAWGLSLAGTYLAWAAVTLLLYPPVCWFSKRKARRSEWWLSYL